MDYREFIMKYFNLILLLIVSYSFTVPSRAACTFPNGGEVCNPPKIYNVTESSTYNTVTVSFTIDEEDGNSTVTVIVDGVKADESSSGTDGGGNPVYTFTASAPPCDSSVSVTITAYNPLMDYNNTNTDPITVDKEVAYDSRV